MNYFQTLTDVGSVNEQGQTVLCRMTSYISMLPPDGNVYDCLDFSRFISRPPTKGDFVPTNEKGEVLEKPRAHERWLHWKTSNDASFFNKGEIESCEEYEAAEKRVMFDNFKVIRNDQLGVQISDTSSELPVSIVFRKNGSVQYYPNDIYINTLEDFPNNAIELILKKP